jgi:hypothetical protein
MSFKIIVKRIDTIRYVDNKWQQVANTGNPRDGGPVFDYAPIEGKRDMEIEILQQTVETLDVAELARFINREMTAPDPYKGNRFAG